MTGILDLPAREPDAVLRYGEAPEHVADRYGSRSASSGGLVVLLHGGFWRNRYDRLHARPLAAALADHGYDVLVPEYRRIGDEGGGWPGTSDDVRAVIASLPTLAPGDQRRTTTLVGHSAGGHLALWSQAAHPSPHVDAVVALAGVVDLEAAARERLSDDAVAELLGSAFPQQLPEADPAQLPAPPMRFALVHGDRDDVVPVEQSRRYAALHPRAELHELAGVGHFELIDPREPAFDAVLRALEPQAHVEPGRC